MNKKFLILSAAFALFSLQACKDDDNSLQNLRLDIDGLEDLGSAAQYEGWIIVDGNAITTGVFTVDANGNMSTNDFPVEEDLLDDATTFVLTIEPIPDPSPSPSDVHILAGDFSGTNASLTISHGAALNNDFTTASGSYILATPTNSDNNDELSGIWWLDPNAGPGAGLNLPTLPAGWAYEGWVVMNGMPISTGTFTDPTTADNNAPFSGTQAGPPFPGEDFLQNAPAGLTFPTDLSSAVAVISIEPVPDNSTAPFLLKPLVGNVPANAQDHFSYQMDNNAAMTNPTGTASRN